MERRLALATAERVRAKYGSSATRKKKRKPGFWDKIVIVLILGAIIGVAGSRAYYERRIEEAIRLQRLVHKKAIYEIREVKPMPAP